MVVRLQPHKLHRSEHFRVRSGTPCLCVPRLRVSTTGLHLSLGTSQMSCLRSVSSAPCHRNKALACGPSHSRLSCPTTKNNALRLNDMRNCLTQMDCRTACRLAAARVRARSATKTHCICVPPFYRSGIIIGRLMPAPNGMREQANCATHL